MNVRGRGRVAYDLSSVVRGGYLYETGKGRNEINLWVLGKQEKTAK